MLVAREELVPEGAQLNCSWVFSAYFTTHGLVLAASADEKPRMPTLGKDDDETCRTHVARRAPVPLLNGFLVACALALHLLASPAAAQVKPGRLLALVISNSSYLHGGTVSNVDADGNLVASALRARGFDVTAGRNLGQSDMRDLIGRFQSGVRRGDLILIYYSGFAVERDGVDYLLPVDVNVSSPEMLPYQGISTSVLFNYNEKPFGVIFAFDGCRDTPFHRRTRGQIVGTRGVVPPIGTMIIMSSSAGTVSEDTTKENSVFATALSNAISADGISSQHIYQRVLREVQFRTGNRQAPQRIGDLPYDVYFDPEDGEDLNVSQTKLANVRRSPRNSTISRYQSPERRVALVIGNSIYDSAPTLKNPANDAAAVAISLRQAGFQTVEIRGDLDQKTFRQALYEFSSLARTSDVALVHYSGHGIEVGGVNYLVPKDAKLQVDTDVEFEGVPLDLVLRAVSGARVMRVVLLDACRNNPFVTTMRRSGPGTRSMGRGLQPVEPSANTLVLYAAKAGSTATDGDTHLSPFSESVARHLPDPGLEINKFSRVIRDEVLEKTLQQQEPFAYGSLSAQDFYFVPPRN